MKPRMNDRDKSERITTAIVVSSLSPKQTHTIRRYTGRAKESGQQARRKDTEKEQRKNEIEIHISIHNRTNVKFGRIPFNHARTRFTNTHTHGHACARTSPLLDVVDAPSSFPPPFPSPLTLESAESCCCCCCCPWLDVKESRSRSRSPPPPPPPIIEEPTDEVDMRRPPVGESPSVR